MNHGVKLLLEHVTQKLHQLVESHFYAELTSPDMPCAFLVQLQIQGIILDVEILVRFHLCNVA